MSSEADERLVIGVGQSERQDDGVGPYVARGLGRRGVPGVVHEGEGTGLLDLWNGKRVCCLVDALAGEGAPGSIRLFTDFDAPGFLRADFVHSSHQIGLPEAIALARELGRLPERLVVIGIIGAAFGFGSGLSPPVAQAAERVIESLATAESLFADEALSGVQR